MAHLSSRRSALDGPCMRMLSLLQQQEGLSVKARPLWLALVSPLKRDALLVIDLSDGSVCIVDRLKRVDPGKRTTAHNR